jgi:hypothetical protein
VVGGVAGGISGLLGVDEAARFHYVMREHRSFYRYSEAAGGNNPAARGF